MPDSKKQQPPNTPPKDNNSEGLGCSFWVFALVISSIYIGLVIYAPKLDYNYFSRVYYVSQVIVGFFIIITFFAALFQCHLSSKQNIDTQKQHAEVMCKQCELFENQIEEVRKDRFQRAIDLAGYYKDNILGNIAVIFFIYRKSKLYTIYEKKNICDMSDFDFSEWIRLYSQEDRQKMMEITESGDFIKVLKEANYISRFCSDPGISKISDENFDSEASEADANLKRSYSSLITSTLNNLEYFSMHFVHCTAEGDVVYQSLHQTFLDLVIYMHWTISLKNSSNSEKFYTNTIRLFNQWRDYSLEQKKAERRTLNSTKEVVKDGPALIKR